MNTINVIKKNRKYFACTLDSGAKCKLVIDQNTEELPLGTHTLELEDRSVRTKYGTDVIFALATSAKEQADAGICTLVAPFNEHLVRKCKGMGGKFDWDAKAWVFSGLIADAVEELEAEYADDMTAVEIVALEELEEGQGSVDAAGYPIAIASGRDSGAELARGVSKVSGSIGSGGSVKNWKTFIEEGAVFRLMIAGALLPELEGSTRWSVKVL